MYTPSLFVKHLILSFLQQAFKNNYKYTWNQAPQTTKIIIADKYAVDTGVAAKRPSIILDRGSIGWTMNLRNEAFPNTSSPLLTDVSGIPKGSSSFSQNYTLTDLMSASVALTVIDKLPFAADEIANRVFLELSGRRELLKTKGIHKFQSLTIGREGVVRVGSDIELVAVPVSFSFLWKETIALSEQLYNARVYVDNKEVYEGNHFTITENGTHIKFTFPLDPDRTATIDYIDAITLDEVLNKELVRVEDDLFLVPENGTIYGFYEILADIFLEEVEIQN